MVFRLVVMLDWQMASCLVEMAMLRVVMLGDHLVMMLVLES